MFSISLSLDCNGVFAIKAYTPSLALMVGHSLKKCAQYTKKHPLQAEDGFLKDKAANFHQLCSIDWSGEVSGLALSTLNENRYNQPNRIPLVGGIRKLHMHLEERARTMIKLLETSPSEKTWRQHSSACWCPTQERKREVVCTEASMDKRRKAGSEETLGKAACDGAMKDSRLQKRSWKSIKYFVKNSIDRSQRETK